MRHHVVLLLACCGSPVLGFVPQMRHGGPRPANRASLASPEPLAPSVSAGLSMKIRTPTAPIDPATLLVAAVLTASLLAPVQATAMGGGGASAGGSSASFSPGISSFSYSPSTYSYSRYYSPPPASLYIFPPSPPDLRTKAEIAADEKSLGDGLKTVALGGAGFLGYSALRSKSRAKMPVGGRSRDTVLAERRAKVDSWPRQWFANKELELRPPNGAWVGTYTQRGSTRLRFGMTSRSTTRKARSAVAEVTLMAISSSMMAYFRRPQAALSGRSARSYSHVTLA